MASRAQTDRLLAVVAATLNEHRLERFDALRVRELILAALGEEVELAVDGGGGLHDHSGARIGAIRPTSSGEWIVDPQNVTAPGADAEIPAKGEDD